MSLLHDRSFALYSLRKLYLEKFQDGAGERVIHIDHELYSRAWGISDTNRQKSLGTNSPPQFDPEFQYSPPIPTFIESDRLGSPNSTPKSRANGLSFNELAEAMEGASRTRKERRRKNRSGGTERGGSSDSDFEDDENDYDSEYELYSDGSNETETGRDQVTENPTLDEENDEMEIEELQRAARQIKFSKMPARAKDLIPDVDQMLSTYIQTNNRKNQHKKQQSGDVQHDEVDSQSDKIGLAGNSESKEGITFLQSSSFRRAVSFDKRYRAGWSDISMDDSIMEDELNQSTGISPSKTVNHESAPAELNLSSGSPVTSSTLASSETLPSPLVSSASVRDLARIEVKVVKVSNLTNLIKLSQTSEKNPFEIYTSTSGVGELKPLKLKVYRPASATPAVSFEVIVKPYVTVADTIGYSLYRYWEEKRKPPLTEDECDVNKWTLRIVEEDGEPDRDFPALDRTRIISAFSFDEFALVAATPREVFENQMVSRKTSL
ncbi:stress-activated map kinase interacting protein 1-domain-containing protein [Lipomyces arxii]|uniref:stress-activated map kinase interacting protein 1-domain-containing protein n=1 Tax=Lipomyces arxii TaxID=56418 RepID=UPI0034CF8B98